MSEINALKEQILELVGAYSKLHFSEQQFIPGETPIPPSGKLIGEEEIRNLVESSLDGWLTSGRFNDEFERQLSKYLGIKHVLTTNSGSSANLLAVTALTSERLGEKALKPGDEVITVAAGFPTTINPIIQNGLIPVFVDIQIPTYNIDTNLLEKAISSRTRAIILAHTLGNPFNIDAVLKVAKKHDLWLIEDNCDALGSEYSSADPTLGKRKTGTFGDIGTLSFYPAHHITMGEGGAVFTSNGKLKSIIESFRDWGRDCFCPPGKDNSCGKRFCWKKGDLPDGYDHKYMYSHLGYNLKITDMQAACGLAQLKRIEEFTTRRRQNFITLQNALGELNRYLILPEATPGSSPSWFGFPITLKRTSPVSRLELLQRLDTLKIGTRLLFAGNVIRQPYMKNREFRVSDSLKNTDTIMQDTFWIGVQPALSSEMLNFTASSLKDSFCKA